MGLLFSFICVQSSYNTIISKLTILQSCYRIRNHTSTSITSYLWWWWWFYDISRTGHCFSQDYLVTGCIFLYCNHSGQYFVMLLHTKLLLSVCVAAAACRLFIHATNFKQHSHSFEFYSHSKILLLNLLQTVMYNGHVHQSYCWNICSYSLNHVSPWQTSSFFLSNFYTVNSIILGWHNRFGYCFRALLSVFDHRWTLALFAWITSLPITNAACPSISSSALPLPTVFVKFLIKVNSFELMVLLWYLSLNEMAQAMDPYTEGDLPCSGIHIIISGRNILPPASNPIDSPLRILPPVSSSFCGWSMWSTKICPAPPALCLHPPRGCVDISVPSIQVFILHSLWIMAFGAFITHWVQCRWSKFSTNCKHD